MNIIDGVFVTITKLASASLWYLTRQAILPYSRFFEFIHNVIKRRKALLSSLIGLLME